MRTTAAVSTSLLERWRAEKESSWLYLTVAATERDTVRSDLFGSLSIAAAEQADLIAAEMIRQGDPDPPVFSPSVRARWVATLCRLLGPRRCKPMLAAMKVRGLSVYLPGAPMTEHPMPTSVADVGHRHSTASGTMNLRAAVFGINDGLVSNAALILGVAGATADADIILLSGLAGLLAGAFSMAAGEYVSVRSQRELYEYQIEQERAELEQYPEEEAEELALILSARGLPIEQARRTAAALFKDPEQALRSLSIEELGVNPDELGSPWIAASSSLLSFALGAALPLSPFVISSDPGALIATVIISAIGLFAVGSAVSTFSGRSALIGGLRMLAIGAAAGLATFAVGRALGITLA